MTGLLKFHRIAAARGDGLHPRLVALLEQREAVAGGDPKLTEIDAQDLSVADLMADEEPLLTVGAMLGNTTLRDILIEEALRQPAPAAGLLLAAARTFDGFIRSNALALYALCALELTLSMRAMPALSAVLLEDPGHSLSALLFDACRAGAFDTLLEAVREGSRLVRAAHGVTDGVGMEAA